jgi:uncharacterized membrane protein
VDAVLERAQGQQAKFFALQVKRRGGGWVEEGWWSVGPRARARSLASPRTLLSL